MNDLELLVAELRKNLAASGKTAATGLMVADILENWYTCLETLFLRVSQSFENHLEASKWHSALLDHMALRVPGLREPLITDETRRDLAEILRFRHFKRYYFEFEYDWERLDFLLARLKSVHPRVLAEIEDFIGFLGRAAGQSQET